jgi:hypothetical protein
VRTWWAAILSLGAAATLNGCSAGMSADQQPVPAPDAKLNTLVSGASDSLESIPGSPDAPFVYRFRQTAPSGTQGFAYQDRDLSFSFRPGPDALYFQVENRQNRVVWIDWSRSVFYTPTGRTDQVAHSSTHFEDRYKAQPNTQISGLKRYGDYVFPLGYLTDPAGSGQQLHRPLLPEDTTSPQYADRDFGVDLVFILEDKPRTYPFKFKVASVTPR